MFNWMASSNYYKLFISLPRMSQKVEASRQALRDDPISHLDIAVEMVHSLSQGANNAPDRLSHIALSQKVERQQISASDQGEKRRVREGLRARRLKASIIKEQTEQKNEQQHVQCLVCSEQCSRKEIKVFGDCGHKFCQACLHQHINNSIKSFKTVSCLDQNCAQSLDISSPHIRALKLPQQEKYYKIKVFLNLSKDQDIRMCPTENCEGFIKMSEEKVQCAICCISFCKICLLPRHSGTCDQNGVVFFEDNYLYKRCSKCRMVLEKNEGCDHMTCKCGYQFCYLCGQQWSNNHHCKPVTVPVPVVAPAPAQVRQIEPVLRQSPVSIVVPHTQVLPRLPNNQPRVAQQQLDQASNIVLNPSASNPAISQVPNQNCLISSLKTILIALMVIPAHFLTIQFCFPIFFCFIAPILISVFYFFYSLVVGMQNMIQDQSWLKIALLNIFLYIYYVLDCYCRKWDVYFRQYYCPKILNIQFLFPISSLITRLMKEYLH